MKKSFILYHDQYAIIKKLSKEQKGELLELMFLSNIGEELPECDPIVDMAFTVFKLTFDRDGVKWEARSNRNKENGKKGGRPKGNKNEVLPDNPGEPKNPSGLSGLQKEPRKAVSDSLSDSVSLSGSGSSSEIKDSIKDTVRDGSASTSVCPQKKVVKIWNELMPELPPVREWSGEAEKNLRARWRSNHDYQNLGWWNDFLNYIKQSDFLMGRAGTFQASFDWVVRPTNFAKIINGNYENRSTGQSQLSRDNAAACRAFIEED